MELRLAALNVFLLLAVVVSHAALPSQIRWNRKLLTVPKLKTIQDVLQPDEKEGSGSTNIASKANIHIARFSSLPYPPFGAPQNLPYTSPLGKPRENIGTDIKRWHHKLFSGVNTPSDDGMKQFVVGQFFSFKVVDLKLPISQIRNFRLVMHDIHVKVGAISESFSAASFKNYLKHKCTGVQPRVLLVHANDVKRASQMKNSTYISVANRVESVPKNNKRRKHNGTKRTNQGKRKCEKCKKTCHKKEERQNSVGEGYRNNKPSITKEEQLSINVSEIKFSALVSEDDIVGTNTNEWPLNEELTSI